MGAQFLSIFLVFMTFQSVFATITLKKAVFKLNYVKHGERIQRVKTEVNGETISTSKALDAFQIEPTDSINIQLSFLNEKEEPTYIKQPFLRIENIETKQDNLYLLKRRGKDMRLDLSLRKEVQADLDFWQKEYSYRLQIIIGDLKLKESRTWTITDHMSFQDDVAKSIFEKPARNVFDFDVGVKKTLLPEFSFPIPSPEKRASLPIVIVGLVSIFIPWIVLLISWKGLGAFNLRLPSNKGEKIMFIVFEICVLAHLVALGMFWYKWNIVTTGKVVGVLMVPTLVLGRNLLPLSKED